MWLKTYLSFGDDRPQWCFAVDEMLALFPLAVDADVVDKAMRTNPYLQRWGPKLKDKTGVKGIGKDLKKMFNVGEMYGISQDAIAISREIQRNMPIWYHAHSNGSRGIFNRSEGIIACLKVNHKIRTVGDAELLAEKLNTRRHTPGQSESCSFTRVVTGCENPGLCYEKCKTMLDVLDEKWDPRYKQPEDDEDEIAPQANNDPDTVEFDPRITTHGTTADTFRIFTMGDWNEYSYAPDVCHETGPNDTEITAYTDGSALNNGTADVAAGTGVFFGENDDRNLSLRIPNELNPSNQVAEMITN
ncbi:hypothetical protein C8J57DRAFT_1083029 [Mycena rebaudengoi]|nr:hypothetical protein C8J57DRAFT_1083029 [Mycena rebaudengoi]